MLVVSQLFSLFLAASGTHPAWMQGGSRGQDQNMSPAASRGQTCTVGPPAPAGCSPSSAVPQAGASSSCKDIKDQMESLEMGSWGRFHTFMPSKSSMGLSGPAGAWLGGCLRPWELLHVMPCANTADNTSFEVWDISPEQTPGKEKLVKCQLLPGRDSWVTQVITLCCLSSPHPIRKALCPPSWRISLQGRLRGSPTPISLPWSCTWQFLGMRAMGLRGQLHGMLHPGALQEVEAASCGPFPDGGDIQEQGHIPKGLSLRCDRL